MYQETAGRLATLRQNTLICCSRPFGYYNIENDIQELTLYILIFCPFPDLISNPCIQFIVSRPHSENLRCKRKFIYPHGNSSRSFRTSLVCCVVSPKVWNCSSFLLLRWNSHDSSRDQASRMDSPSSR